MAATWNFIDTKFCPRVRSLHQVVVTYIPTETVKSYLSWHTTGLGHNNYKQLHVYLEGVTLLRVPDHNGFEKMSLGKIAQNLWSWKLLPRTHMNCHKKTLYPLSTLCENPPD